MKKIISSGNQMFSVPNDDEGKLFLKLLTKYRNKHKGDTFKRRGRGNRASGRFNRDVPISNANWIAVYVYNNKQDEARYNQYREYHGQISKLLGENADLKEKVALLEKMNEETIKESYNLEKEYQDFVGQIYKNPSPAQETTSITITVPKNSNVKVVQE